jgi:hypothetical protein
MIISSKLLAKLYLIFHAGSCLFYAIHFPAITAVLITVTYCNEVSRLALPLLVYTYLIYFVISDFDIYPTDFTLVV